MTDPRNLRDKYKGLDEADIKAALDEESIPVIVALMNLTSDFNKSSAIRNANNFGVRDVYIVGNKKWDRRGAVGTHHYTNVTHFMSLYGVVAKHPDYEIVGVEQAEDSLKLGDFLWIPNTIMVFGEENRGLSKEELALCDRIVEIPSHGSVRSINVASACGIALYDYRHCNVSLV